MSHGRSEHGLERRLGLFSVTSIVIANIVGAGIFTTSGLLMQDLGNASVMIALWVLGGLIALAGALCYGELGAAIPRAGGEYAFLSRLFHPRLGFLSGWVSFFAGFSAPIAASAIGFSEYLTRAFPQLTSIGLIDASVEATVVKKLLAITVILIFTTIHMRGLELGATVQNVLTVLKVVLIIGLIVLGFSFGEGSMDRVVTGASFDLDFAGFKTLGLSLMWIMFAYSGWNAAAYIGSEIKNPARNLPWSLILGTGVVIVLYFCINLFYVFAVPPERIGGVISIAGLAVSETFGASLGSVVSVLVAFALFSSLSAFIILGPRVYYAMARDGLFFRFASDVHPKHGVPSKSILLQGTVASIMVLLGTFDQILTYMAFALGIFPLLAVLGVFLLRKRGMLTFRMPGFPVTPIFYMLCGTTILVLAFLERPTESLIAILTVVVGLPVYAAFRSRQTKPLDREATEDRQA